MITYQDLIEKTTETDKMALIEQAIREHQASEQYKLAVIAEKYFNHENPTIMAYEKYIYDTLGKVKDITTPNHKIANDIYYFFITQLTQYLLSNGVFFDDDSIKEKIINFDEALSKLSTNAQNHGVSFGFFNNGKIETFSLLEFVPLYDEENGAIRAGARFWQLASDKPLRITLFEEDGATEYIKRKGEATEILKDKQAYTSIVNISDTGIEIIEGRNYPKLPIVPFYNVRKQSALKGNRGVIDAYDLVSSKMINNISEGDLVYWIINNCGGMDLADDQDFLDRIRRFRVVHSDDAGTVESKTIEIPHEATDSALMQLRRELFDNFMAFDVNQISAGNVTATQINASYQQLDNKADMYEYEVIKFIKGILSLIGIEAEPSFKRNRIANMVEESEMVLSAVTVIGEEMTIKKLPFLTPDEAEEVIQKRMADELKMINMSGAEEVEAGEE